MTIMEYLADRRKYINEVLSKKNTEVQNNVADMFNSPTGVVGDFSSCDTSDINPRDLKYINGVIKHLGTAERCSCHSSEKVLRTYIDAVFDVVTDLVAQSMAGSLNYPAWFVMFALNRGILIVQNDSFMWADLGFEERTYLDLFTRYFMCWNDQYNKTA